MNNDNRERVHNERVAYFTTITHMQEAMIQDENRQVSEYQLENLLSGCPECGSAMHAVPSPDEDEETGKAELYLWCNSCDVSMDSSGGYTK